MPDLFPTYMNVITNANDVIFLSFENSIINHKMFANKYSTSMTKCMYMVSDYQGSMPISLKGKWMISYTTDLLGAI